MTSQSYIPIEHEANEDHGISVLNQKDHEKSAEIIEEVSPVHNLKRPRLSVEIPSKDSGSPSMTINMPTTPSSDSTNVDLCRTSTPTSAKGKPSIKNLLARLSFKSRSSTAESEASGSHNRKPSTSRSLSFTRLFMPTVSRTSSSPVNPVTLLKNNSLPGVSTVDQPTSVKKGVQKHISRSLSVPVNTKSRSIKRAESLGSGFRVFPSTPRATNINLSVSDSINDQDSEIDGDGEDIPEDEAVCRICMIELREGGDTIKLECNCKGELALAHEECVVKWFSIRGNKTCEVCKQEVQNLPVTLLRIQFVTAAGTGNDSRQTTRDPLRLWLDMPVLVIVSMLSYFCFLEQLLVFNNGSAALAISLPFSCILGFLASMTSSAMVIRKYSWAYASIQFVLVVLSAHLFYSVAHMQAIMSIILSAFSGFGITMSGSSVIVEFLRWRRRRRVIRRSSVDLPSLNNPSASTASNIHESNSIVYN
ncbi:uncharacterized protein A4U43_C01F8360 [Asparagus officinalis]|uniref:Uncharacterized protein n=1 Tax=Asparagus officinalis TaxID=4686 RepID=A0A5P1FPJ6_ASPOF|nr:probable E3 ubiquitin-protein ligase MARCH10 isoform X2 [Asparagus officinalis]ONK79633.1 uncharacterized protein A4U43_C01F8360 [Asparagus officinalis]